MKTNQQYICAFCGSLTDWDFDLGDEPVCLKCWDERSGRENDYALKAAANKEKVAASKRRYYEANREKVLAYHRRYYEANREKAHAYHRRYYEANKEKAHESIK